MKRVPLAAVLAGLACLAPASAQVRPSLPAHGPAPLLYATFVGEPGMRLTFYQGAESRDLALPVTVGLRPGYRYRLKLTGLPDRAHVALYPTLEVLGSLKMTPRLDPARYPAVISFSGADGNLVLNSRLLTKVVYVEDPRKALAEQGRLEEPIETEVAPGRDPLEEARNFGRPVAVLRVGNRTVPEAEMLRSTVPGTILFPGQMTLRAPAFPPQLPWACFPTFDPILGPRSADEECLKDGGDRGAPVGYDREGKLAGLDPEDTVIEYRNSRGQRKIAVSNRVCLCVPRFGVVRSALQLESNDLRLALQDVHTLAGQAMTQQRSRTSGYRGSERLVEVGVRQSPSQVENLSITAITGKVEGLAASMTLRTTSDLSAVCREEPTEVERPLILKKWVDSEGARVGDIVTFYIRFANPGEKPITDVVISDSLTTRLQYIPGSAQSSRPATFTTQENSASSVSLRWEMETPLQPGESGVVSFKARIR